MILYIKNLFPLQATFAVIFFNLPCYLLTSYPRCNFPLQLQKYLVALKILSHEREANQNWHQANCGEEVSWRKLFVILICPITNICISLNTDIWISLFLRNVSQ
jgi:hypothetical protein